MSQKEKDVRFSKVYNDPRFRTFRKVDKTLKIDKRFKSMFTEDKFKLKYSMDKRGKNKKHLISDDYKKFYRLSDDEEEKDKNETVDEKGDDQIDDNGDVPFVEKESDQVGSETSDEEEENKKDKPAVTKLTHKFGYHRGLNRPDEESSSSSSSESEESEEENDLEVDHEWGELDRDADQIDDATSRIAICNADWDCINAQDLFVLLNSFKRATGAIHYVRIYYSKFGEERLQVEERKGPSEFIFGKATKVEEIDEQVVNSQSEENDDGESSDDDDDDEQQESADEEDGDDTDPKAIEKLRKYQLERLKYFYAVVEFDCSETAEVVYNELDGMEYESSSSTLDIRFIPDDMNFDDVKLKEECTLMPNSNNYIAPNFINTALQQSHVTLTWDETNHKRKSAFDRAFDKDNEDDLKAYLATSSEDDQEEEEEVEIDANLKDHEKIKKYKDLLKSFDKDNDGEIEMEVTWDPSLKSNAEKLIKKRDSSPSDNSKSITNKSIDNYSADSEEEVLGDQLVDDSEEEKAKPDTSKDKYKKWKKKKADKKEAVNSNANEDQSNLELLMVDMEKSGGNKKHFNYKEIVDNYSKKNHSKNATQLQPASEDSFKFDADDPRFGAIFSSHLYNIDQSDPSFKKTEVFNQILNRRKSKAAQLVKEEKSIVPKMEITKPTGGKSWTSLVSKVKSNTDGISQKRPTVNNKANTNSRFNTNKKFRR